MWSKLDAWGLGAGSGARTKETLKGLEKQIKVEILVGPGVTAVVTDPPS